MSDEPPVRTMHEILQAAEKRVLPPSRHAGTMRANNMVIISTGDDRVIRVTVDGRRVLHIKVQPGCAIVMSAPAAPKVIELDT